MANDKTKVLSVGELSASAGSKVQGYLEVEGTPVKMPITLINGVNEGKTVVITGGTHGGEYPGVEASIRLAKTLQPAEVSGQLIIVHPVNVPAFQAKLQYVGPYDGKNLNREYPGLATGTVTQRIAYTISSQLFTQILALCKDTVIRSLMAHQSFSANNLGAGCFHTLYPVTHPLSIAPSV